MQENVEELHRRLARHFEDGNEEAGDKPPIVKFPKQPTVEEWEKHKTTHTPYESWCPHCNAARAVRREHTRINQRAHMVKDVESNDNGPVRISMDYMYHTSRSATYHSDPLRQIMYPRGPIVRTRLFQLSRERRRDGCR